MLPACVPRDRFYGSLIISHSTNRRLDLERNGDRPITTGDATGQICRFQSPQVRERYDAYGRAAAQQQVRSASAFPVKIKGRTIGVLTVTSADQHRFAADDLRAGRRIAEALALFLTIR